MPVRSALFAALLLIVPAFAQAEDSPAPATSAQVTSLRGKFQDPSTMAVVAGVAVKLTNMADTTDVHRVTGKDDGTFEIKGLGVHSYRLETTRLGYTALKTIIRVTKNGQDAGVLALTTESVPVSGITVTESPAPAAQKADTTEYRASAVKINKDATAEDLVQKLPGVTMENGQVKAHGENVQNVLVNGRPFFGSDPTTAMRNLPAEVVDRIQVYDKASDQAEFSGFDDGQSQKTMNFVLKDLKVKFGKVYGGYGDQDRYQGGGNMTIVRGPTRVTGIGMSNNINQRNFSLQDLFGGLTGSGGGGGGPRIMTFGGGGGGGFRGGGGGGGGQIIRMGGFGGGAFDPSSFLVGQQTGVSTTHSGGLNYVGQWSPRFAVSSSFFANGSNNDNVQTLSRQYLPPQDSLAFYDQQAVSDNKNRNERFDARFEFTADSSNSFIMQPRLYFQRTDARSNGDGANSTAQSSALSAAHNASTDGADGNNLSDRLTLRHRFAKRGRNVSADINVGHTVRNGDDAQRSVTDYYLGTDTTITLDQQSNSHTVTNSFSTRIAYTEPLTSRLQAQAIYNPSLTRSTADARAFQLDTLTSAYTIPDNTLSNSYQNRNTIQNGGLAFLYTRGIWRWLTNVSYQQIKLHSEQTYPLTHLIDHTYDDVLPSMSLTANFPDRSSLRLQWNTSASTPTIGQLQNVVNNSNPLSLSTGNPALRTTYNNSVSLRWLAADPRHSKSKFLFANATRTTHTIANATLTALSDTTIDGTFLARGTQLTRPVNLGESWNANLFGVYSLPAKFMKSILSFNSGGTFSRTPTQINGITNVGSTYGIRSGLTVSSNISPNLDFTVSYQGTYNLSRYTMSTSNRGDYYTHTIGVRFNAVAPHGIVLRQEVNHNLQTGVPSAYGQDIVLWNTTLGKKFLKKDAGELRVTMSDVLQQNRSVSRSVTESYVQDTRDRTLGRFVQAVFTYTFR